MLEFTDGELEQIQEGLALRAIELERRIVECSEWMKEELAPKLNEAKTSMEKVWQERRARIRRQDEARRD